MVVSFAFPAAAGSVTVCGVFPPQKNGTMVPPSSPCLAKAETIIPEISMSDWMKADEWFGQSLGSHAIDPGEPIICP